MLTLYVETSALLRVALEGDLALQQRLADADRSLTSALTRLEADRALRRALASKRLSGDRQAHAKQWVDEFLATCNEIALDGSVLLVSCDVRVRANALALGYDIAPD